ncbi:hypothetical protein FKP32DRAFT_1681390 [Trametes sanguinea]|nr:hypothetical protein FKP32DRAFT_1681390 [Trametes sanguinea]
MPLPIPCPDIPLFTSALTYRLELAEPPVVNTRWFPGQLLIGVLGEATWSGEDVYGPEPPTPVLSTVIEDWLQFSCDEGDWNIVLKSKDTSGDFPPISLRFEEPLDFYELVSILHDAKSHIARQKDRYKDMLKALLYSQFVRALGAHSANNANDATPGGYSTGRTDVSDILPPAYGSTTVAGEHIVSA